MVGIEDFGAFIVVFIAIMLVFLGNKWFFKTKNKYNWIMIIFVYYTAMAILPTLYNYLVDSPFKSLIILGINIIPVIILIGYNVYTDRIDKT